MPDGIILYTFWRGESPAFTLPLPGAADTAKATSLAPGSVEQA